MKHLIDTTPKLAECARCHAYVLAGMDSGTRYAVDMTPLNLKTARALILSGVVMHLRRESDSKIIRLTASSMTKPKSEGYYRAHGCGCSALDASAFEEREIPPPQAPVPSELAQGLAALMRPDMSCSVVQDVRPHRSDIVRCAECGVLMDHEPMIMVEAPVWQVNTLKVPNRGSRKGYTREFEGWGWIRWAIHPDGCHVSTPTKQRSRR